MDNEKLEFEGGVFELETVQNLIDEGEKVEHGVMEKDHAIESKGVTKEKETPGYAGVEIIAEPRIKNIMAEALKDVNYDGKVAVIAAEYFEESHRRSEAYGLTLAEQLADEYDQVIVIGFLTPAMYAAKPAWHAAMAHPNVYFTSIITSLSELKSFIEGDKPERPSDPLGLEMKNFSENKQLIRSLLHDYPHAVRNGTLDDWENRARKIFGEEISLNEIIERLHDQRENEAGRLEGREFPDLCVDIEGTLIQGESLNHELLKLMKEESKVRPITIWSGGDLDKYSKILRRSGIEYKIISKYWMKDTKVAKAIDDLPKEEFESTYGINVDEYTQIK